MRSSLKSLAILRILVKLEAKAKILVIGGAAVDIIAKPGSDINSPSVLSHTTVPGSISSSLGGVARNIAEAAHRVRSARDSLKTTDVLLVAPIGSDNFGRLLHSETRSLSMRTDGLISSPPEGKLTRTAVCNMILDRAGSLIGGVADMDIASSLEFIQVTSNFDPFSMKVIITNRLNQFYARMRQILLRSMEIFHLL